MTADWPTDTRGALGDLVWAVEVRPHPRRGFLEPRWEVHYETSAGLDATFDWWTRTGAEACAFRLVASLQARTPSAGAAS